MYIDILPQRYIEQYANIYRAESEITIELIA